MSCPGPGVQRPGPGVRLPGPGVQCPGSVSFCPECRVIWCLVSGVPGTTVSGILYSVPRVPAGTLLVLLYVVIVKDRPQ